MTEGQLPYQRAKFATKLPKDRLYTESHFWLAREPGELWRIGFTKFATRMLGEVVEYEFGTKPGDPIELGQVVGWVEGFKAVSDLYAPMAGRFAGANPELERVVGEIHKQPHDQGWLYRIEGEEPDDAMSAEEYAGFLDRTIDRMLEKKQG
jgi:glycine cleavage system H protein